MAELNIPDWEEIKEEEPVLVLDWRLAQAKVLGVPTEFAHRFAESDADLERLRKLVRQGCQPETAARILL